MWIQNILWKNHISKIVARWVMLVGQACFRWDQLIQMESQTHFLSCPVPYTPLHSASADIKKRDTGWEMLNTKWAHTDGVPCFLRLKHLWSMLYNVQCSWLYNDARNPKYKITHYYKCWKYDYLSNKAFIFLAMPLCTGCRTWLERESASLVISCSSSPLS